MKREAVLDAAKKIVTGEREGSYGSPEDSFARIASLWSAAFDRTFTRAEVAIALGLVKIARLTKDESHEDSWIDLAGYAATGSEAAASREAYRGGYKDGIRRALHLSRIPSKAEYLDPAFGEGYAAALDDLQVALGRVLDK